MIAENVGRDWLDRERAVPTERALREQRLTLRKLLRAGMALVDAVIMGAQHPIRTTVTNIQDLFSRHLVDATR